MHDVHARPVRPSPRILVRPVRPEDDAGLLALYETLDIDDRYRRFFSAHHPHPGFYADLATVPEGDGARLVAVLLSEPPGEDRIVGEAGYQLLANGHGELAITVAHEWQGWLRSYLVDALFESARAAGVPCLEADVLSIDGPTLDLLRSAGSVVMEQRNRTVVRVLVGTGGRSSTSSPKLDERAIA